MSNPFLQSIINIAESKMIRIIDRTFVMQDGNDVECPSYLEQLRDAIANKGSSRNGTGSAKSRPLIDVDALDLFQRIDQEWTHAYTSATVTTLEMRIQSWFKWGKENIDDPSQWAIFVGRLDAIEDDIEQLLNPSRRMMLAYACPACHVRMVQKHNLAGELIQCDALMLDGEKGCLCRSCGAQWPTSELEHLAGILGCPSLP